MQPPSRTKIRATLFLLTVTISGATSVYAQEADPADAAPAYIAPAYIAPAHIAPADTTAVGEVTPETYASETVPAQPAPAPAIPAQAAPAEATPPATTPLGTATADFDNLRPDKGETAWGRFVADALLVAGKADIALVNAGTLHRGTLKAGPVEPASIDSLLSFGDDELVTISITGDQLRAALERAAQSYPTASPAFLHCAGLLAQFNKQAPINRRVTLVRFKGREVENADILSVAMPVSLAEGTAGYFTIWNSQGAAHSNFTVRDAVIDLVKNRKEITPDDQPRFSAQ